MGAAWVGLMLFRMHISLNIKKKKQNKKTKANKPQKTASTPKGIRLGMP